MTRINRIVGSGAIAIAALAVTATAVAAPGVAAAQAPAMSVAVSGTNVTISGTCPKGGTDAEGWYGKPNGHQPIKTGKMKNNKGKLSITFSGVAPGSYVGVMGCQTASNTAVKNFTVAAKAKAKTKPAVKKTPKGAPKTGGGSVMMVLPR